MYGRRHTSIPQSFMAVETVLLVLFDVIGDDFFSSLLLLGTSDDDSAFFFDGAILL